MSPPWERGRRALAASSGSAIGLALLAAAQCAAQRPVTASENVRLVPIGEGWARSSVNAVVFRQNSVTSHGDTQYAAYYDADGHVVLAQRRLGANEWDVRRTQYTGNVRDAHNAICIAVDGNGVLHIAWNHHGQPLNYARAVRPGALELTRPRPMTGALESEVTYPQFYNLPDGDLLFVYRHGGSGRGDVLLNRYDTDRREIGRAHV